MSSKNPKEAPPGTEENCEVTPDSEAGQKSEHGSDTTEEGSHDGQPAEAAYVNCPYCRKIIPACRLKLHSCSLCTSCNVNFVTDVQLREHQKRSKWEPTGIVCLPSSTCNVCGLGLWSDADPVQRSHRKGSCLKRWIGQTSMESSSPAPATASSSQYQSSTQSKLAKKPYSDNRKLDNPPKRCTTCRNSFNSHRFNNHKCSFCNQCNTNFSTHSQLRAHQNRSKLENGENGCSPSSQCQVCGLALWSNKPKVLDNHRVYCEKTWIGQSITKPNEEKGTDIESGKEVKVPKNGDLKQMDSQESNEEKHEQDNSPATPQQEDSQSNNQTPASAECSQKKPPESQPLDLRKRCSTCRKHFVPKWFKNHSCSLCKACNTNFANYVHLREHQKRSKLENGENGCSPSSQCQVCGLALWSNKPSVLDYHRYNCEKTWIGQSITKPNEEKGTEVEPGKAVEVPDKEDLNQMESQESNEEKYEQDNSPATSQQADSQSANQTPASAKCSQKKPPESQPLDLRKRCSTCRKHFGSFGIEIHACSLCKACNTNFATSKQLRQHQKRSKLENGENGCSPSSQCPECGLALWSDDLWVRRNHKRNTCEKIWIGQRVTKPNEEKGTDIESGKEVKVPKNGDLKQMDSQESNEEKHEQDNSPATPQQEDSQSNNQTPASAECSQKKPPEGQPLDLRKRCSICRKSFALKFKNHACSFCIHCNTNFATYRQLWEHQNHQKLEPTGIVCLPASMCNVCGLALWSDGYYVHASHRNKQCEKIWIGQGIPTCNEEKGTEVKPVKAVKAGKTLQNSGLQRNLSQANPEIIFQQKPAAPRLTDSQKSNQTPTSTECSQETSQERLRLNVFNIRCHTCRKSVSSDCFEKHACSFCIKCNTNFASHVQLREHQKRLNLENSGSGCLPSSLCQVCGLALWSGRSQVHKSHRQKSCPKIWIGQCIPTCNEEAMDGRSYSNQRCQHGISPFECQASTRDGLCSDWDSEIRCPPVNSWGLRTFACSHCPVYGTELEIQRHIANAHDVKLSLEDLDAETLKARAMNSDASYLTKYENAAKKVKAGKCYICFKQIFSPTLIRDHIQWCQQLQRLHQNPPTDDQELPKDSCSEKKKVTFSSIAAVLIKGWKTKDSGIRNEPTNKPQEKMEESLVKAVGSNVEVEGIGQTENVHSSNEMETDVEEKMCIDAETGN